MGGFSRLQEPRNTASVERVDVHGNVWKGLRITTSIEKQEANRGITINQHYLMLPGVPVLCVLHSVTNESGLALPHYSLSEDSYFKPSPLLSEGWMEVPEEGKFLLGKAEAHLDSKGIMRIGSATRKDMLHIVNSYPNQRGSAYVNNQVFTYGVNHHLPLLNGETAWTQPSFLITGEIVLNPEDVQGLLKLTFNSPTDNKETINANY